MAELIPSPKSMFSLEIDAPLDEECRAWLERVAAILERDVERQQRELAYFGATVIGKVPDPKAGTE